MDCYEWASEPLLGMDLGEADAVGSTEFSSILTKVVETVDEQRGGLLIAPIAL